ncbi:MAG TPA: DUF5683 domain-containing protein [Acidobacteriota bacterium]|nr:DUF5683 domain-containing protein [Acidobacteriota bacterium]
MTLKGTLTVVVLALFLPGHLPAQESVSGGVVVRSTPQGALVRLQGEATVTGITPTVFRYPFVGDYRLTVRKYGYEDYRTHVVLDPARQTELDIALVPKTRWKAAVRSLFIPGWGQKYTEQKGKAWLFAVLTAGTAVAYLVTDHNFDIKFDRYDERLTAFDRAGSEGAGREELQRRLDLLTDAQDEAYDAENVRRVTIGAVMAVWGLNVIDALLFAPEERGSFAVTSLPAGTGAGGPTLGLMISHEF